MSYIGEVGKRLTIQAEFKKSFDYVDYKFSYYGTTNYIHTFEDSAGNVLVWKTTKPVEYIAGDECKRIPKGSIVKLTGTVKEHGMYSDTEQTVITRCKFEVVELGKSERQIQQEKLDAQLQTMAEGDFIREMPYKQYKEHYSDCETVIGSFNRHEDARGIPQRDPTIKVIIRAGRLKPNGVRGKRFYWFTFENESGRKSAYYAVSEETARKQLTKQYPDGENWDCVKIEKFGAMSRF